MCVAEVSAFGFFLSVPVAELSAFVVLPSVCVAGVSAFVVSLSVCVAEVSVIEGRVSVFAAEVSAGVVSQMAVISAVISAVREQAVAVPELQKNAGYFFISSNAVHLAAVKSVFHANSVVK